MGVPITRSLDVVGGYSRHLFLPLPPPPGATPVPTHAIETPTNPAWPPGIGLGSVKKTSTVLHNGRAIILAGHDCGKLIPQITIPTNNALFPLQLTRSSRKVVFNCFSVRMDTLQAACTYVYVPLLSCGDPMPLPLTLNATNFLCHVNLGMSVADIVGGIITTLGTMAVERIFFSLPGGNPTPLEEFGKTFLMGSVGATATLMQHVIDPRYPVKAELSVKVPGGVSVKLSITTDSTDPKNNPTQISLSAERTLAEDPITGSSMKANATVAYTLDAGGDASKEGLKAQGGITAASPAGSVSGSDTLEVHPDLPEGQRVKITGKSEVKTPLFTVSAQEELAPGAPPGEGSSSKIEVSDDASSGVHKLTQTVNPDGTVTTKTIESAPGEETKTTTTTQVPEGVLVATKSPKHGAAAMAAMWGPPL